MAFSASIQAELDKPEKHLSIVVKHQLTPIQSSATEWAYYSGFGPPVAGRPADTGAVKQWFPYLDTFKPSRSMNNPFTGKLTQSDIKFTLLTTNDHVLQQMVGTEDPSGDGASGLNIFQDIAVFFGYPGLVWASWERIFTGRITDIKLIKDGNLWEVTAASALVKAQGDAMTKADSTDLLEGGDMDSWDAQSPGPHDWTATKVSSTTIKESTRPTNQRVQDSEGSSARFNFDSGGNLGRLVQAATVVPEEIYTLEIWAKGDAADIPMEVSFENTTTTNWLSVPETSPGAATVSSTWSASETWLPMVPGNGIFARRLYRFKLESSGTTLNVGIRGTGAGAPPAGVASAVVYVDDVSLTKRVIVSGNPVDLAAAILTDPAVGGSYTFAPDSLVWLAGEPDGAGLGVSISETAPDDIFADTFEEQRDKYVGDDTIDVTFDEPVQALSYLEAQFLRLWGFLYVGPKAMISFQAYHAPEPVTTPVSLGAAQIVKVKSWQRRFDMLTNSVRIWGDFAPQSKKEKFTQLALVQDTAARISADGLKELEIKSKWLQTHGGGVAVASDAANRLFLKFQRAIEQVTLELMPSQLDLNSSDTVKLTDDRIPDLVTRSHGITDATFEPVSVGPDILKARVPVTLIGSYYNRPGFIAPNTSPDYLSATAADRLYAFISDNADGKMSNGDDGYKVQ